MTPERWEQVKALFEAAVARRYASAEQLAADLEQHLRGWPVQARPDSAGYRADKFIRRHKTGVAAAVLLVVTLLGGVVASQWQARRAERQELISRQLLYAAHRRSKL